MKKYYCFIDEWFGPFTIRELLEFTSNNEVSVWYPELCENGIEHPKDCHHNKSNIGKIKRKFQKNRMKKKFIRNIIFTKSRLKGWFRYKNEFQIYPAEFENIPINSNATHFPIVIEFWIDEKDNTEVPDRLKMLEPYLKISESTNSINKVKKICNLLSAITNHRFFFYNHPQGQWFFNVPDGDNTDDLNSQNSNWGYNIFAYPDIKKDMKIDRFTQVDYEQVNPVEHNKYFIYDPIENSRNVIRFPQTMHLALDGFFQLNKKQKKAAEATAHLIANGIDLRYEMKSLSFLSFVSSIETIANLEFTDKNKSIEFECKQCKTIKDAPYKCYECNRPIWGIAAKFREFLAEYIHNSEGSIKKYRKIYNLRSKLVHDGSLLLGDNYIDWGESDKSNSQWMLHLEAMQFSRLMFINWLIRKRAGKVRK